MAQPPLGSSAAATPGLLGRRREFLVNRSFQLRATLFTAAAVLVLLVLLSLVLHSISVSTTNHVLADYPELADVIRAQDRLQLLLILFASALFLAGVFVVSALETHRTAGAAAKLAGHMTRIERGHYNVRLKLRREDHLQEVQTAFNQMSKGLRDRMWHTLETLERLAADAESLDSERGARLAREIRQLARRMRHSVE